MKDQVLLLVEFDQELLEKRKQEGTEAEASSSEAIALLVDHIHSIPVRLRFPVLFNLSQYFNRSFAWFSSSVIVLSISSFT